MRAGLSSPIFLWEGKMGKRWIAIILVSVVLGLVGGVIGGKLFPSRDPELQGDVAGLKRTVEALKGSVAALVDLPENVSSLEKKITAKVSSLEEEIAGLKEKIAELAKNPAQAGAPQAVVYPAPWLGMRVGYVDIDGLLGEIFSERDSMIEAQTAKLSDLKKAYDEGKIDEATYTKELLNIQVEALKFQMDWNFSLLRKLKASFGEIKGALEELEARLKPLEDKVGALEKKAEEGVPENELQDFYSQLQQLQLVFQESERLLSQTLASLLAKVAGEVAQEEGIGLVVRPQDVIYLDTRWAVDLSKKLKERLPVFFGGGGG